LKRGVVRLVTGVAILLLGGVIARAFWSWEIYNVHGTITQSAIGNEFVDQATLQRIHDENKVCDDKSSGKFSDHRLHFDSEAFPEGTQRLAKNLRTCVKRHHFADKGVWNGFLTLQT